MARVFTVVLFLVLAQVASAQNNDKGNTPLPYTLGQGDEIRISVFAEEDLSYDVRLGDSNTISYPLLGEIRVAGLSPVELEAQIEAGLFDGQFLVHPEVTISILEYRFFYINGEVKDPGGYPYQPRLTLRRAAALAGGFTERASHSKITIIPDDGSGVKKPDTVSLETPVNPGDTITVPQRLF